MGHAPGHGIYHLQFLLMFVYTKYNYFILLFSSCTVQRSSEGVHITSEGTEAVINFDPFRIDIRINGEIATVLNSKGLLNFEHYREKK